MRLLAVLVFSLLALAGATGQEEKGMPWQAVITSQIEAFRAEDSAGALALAGAGFKAQFDDPDVFYLAVLAAGYGPLLQSRSHTFGEFERMGEQGALQVVLIVGPEQALYTAIFQMREEPEGWRVHGVMLARDEGVGI
ncbi:hypothetical protein VE25_02925 [Devosia geojensis]|uniref:DUF4864 domain-containing protein n=1 Tax=Devosia geojensis TaxID=443610 RepID=A0A0F5FXF3_9HYPH|nr:DUF4864 domain-containing protein [Devosia geojensis]KKB13250.1 hypothetical protein VE25_02925 [Devosia geojensis]